MKALLAGLNVSLHWRDERNAGRAIAIASASVIRRSVERKAH